MWIKIKQLRCTFFLILMTIPSLATLQTIEEKQDAFLLKKDQKEMRTSLDQLNKKLYKLRSQLEEKYALVNEYYLEEAREEDFQYLLREINDIRSEIVDLEKDWRIFATEEIKKEDEGYALWDQEETSLSHLIMEYGSTDYLYIIPSDISSLKIHMHSSIPIPRESWNDLLEVILCQNGIGIKQLNPYARQLYIMKSDITTVDSIINSPKELMRVPKNSRVIYVFAPPVEKAKRVSQFFEKFRDPKSTFIYSLGHKLAIVSTKEDVEKLLALYEAVWGKGEEKVIRVFPTHRIPPHEMETIIKSYFGISDQKTRMGSVRGDGDDFCIFPLKNEGALVLIGTQEVVTRAEKLINETQSQIEDPMEMTVFSYTCRHSNPSEVSEVLEKVYGSLIYADIRKEEPNQQQGGGLKRAETVNPAYGFLSPPNLFAAQSKETTGESQREKPMPNSFIPFPKTGTIMMVVRRDTLPKIKDLLRKLDVPKKMVQIEVLLFEKRASNENNFGINVLRLGSEATHSHRTGLRYVIEGEQPAPKDRVPSMKQGVVDFFLFRNKSSCLPAFDIAYNFFLSQEDIRVNASPSVTTLNQTPAEISLVDEISISNGVVPVDKPERVAFKESFSRSDYGTKLVITPTVHEPELPEERTHYVTLETDIQFDTIQKKFKADSRPKVFKRHISNQVRVADGETVVLGGLRKKTAEDASRKLPVLGELPIIRKFFSDSQMTDEETEMFICITPKIIFDEKGDLEKMRYEQLIKRPGDMPEFLARIQRAKKRQKSALLEQSLKLFFGGVS